MTTISWNFKTVKLATTPMMSLATLRDQAVAHFQLEGTFGLKKTSSLAGAKRPATLLDMKDTVRLANFAQGQKLELVRLGEKKVVTQDTNAAEASDVAGSGSVATGDVAGATEEAGSSNVPKKVLVNASLFVSSLPPSFSESLHAQFSPSTTIGQMLDFFQQKSGINFQRKLDIREAEDGHKVDLESYIRQGTYNVEFLEGEVSEEASQAKQVKVFEAGKSAVSSDEHDFEPTTAHAHAYISTIRKTGGNKNGLLTEKLRDQQKQAKINQLGGVKVRLRFPDGVYVETEYYKTDTVGSMVDTVKGVLGGEEKFKLWQSYPRKELNDDSLRLMADLGFLTNTLVTVEFPGVAKFDSKTVLKPGVVVETPKPVESEKEVSKEGGSQAKPKKKLTGGTPKWLKLGKK